jgi:16S rRNA (uracil1498-N3)-methyltransferase
MEYFYSRPAQITPTHCVIDENEFIHLTHVMRRKEGDAIRIIDGDGTAYDAVIEEIARRTARCRITARYHRLNEPARRVTIGAAILKSGSAFDYLVEKATELGVAVIAPLLTQRTIPRHDRADRWQKIALAATKQCGRCLIPQIEPMMPLADFFTRAPAHAARIIPHEQVVEKELLSAVPAGIGHVVLCIGPEGGFTEDEVGLAVSAGFIPVSLGPRRLRAETAALVASALCLLEP